MTSRNTIFLPSNSLFFDTYEFPQSEREWEAGVGSPEESFA